MRDNAVLFKKGFGSLSAIATTQKEQFLAKIKEPLGERKATQVYTIARAQQRILNNLLTQIGTEKANRMVPAMLKPAPPTEENTEPGWLGTPGSSEAVAVPEIHSEVVNLFPDPCDCPDCEAAVSPLAYLADLLDYTLDHVTRGEGNEETLTLNDLANLLHQPFGDLPVSCKAAEEQVRQVRLCVEVLRHYLGEPLPDATEDAYCMAAYTTLLDKIGTSYEELRLASTADGDSRQALASRLGILLDNQRPDALDSLLLNPHTVNEAALERLFGLFDTRRDPLTGGPVDGDPQGQIVRWKMSGIAWNRNTDRAGFVYLSLSRPSEGYRVDAFRDAERLERIAAGQIDHSEGTLVLVPHEESELSGTVELDYSGHTEAIAIRVLPEFLCWRLQYLQSFWVAEDGTADRYSATRTAPYRAADMLPVIDPDVIGPDDFRSPFPKAADVDDDRPFDLWLYRRALVDRRRSDLDALRPRIRDQLIADHMVPSNRAILAEILARDLEGELGIPEIRPTWPHTPLPTLTFAEKPVVQLFERLRSDLTAGRDIEETQKHIQDELRLDIDGFLRLSELLDKTRTPEGIDEDEWQEVFSILVQRSKIEQFSEWRRAERRLEASMRRRLFGPRHFWFSLQEPVEGPWPPEQPEDRPLIDPDLLKLSELPEPTAGQRAIALWASRRAQLDELRTDLVQAHLAGGTGGVSTMLNLALGDPPPEGGWEPYLNDLMSRWRRAQASGLEDDQEVVDAELEALYLTAEDLTRLLEILSAESPSEGEWEEVYTLLTTCRKQRGGLLTTWRDEEQNDPVLGGRYWLIHKASLPKWRASASDRQMWRFALERRSRLPIIDPDLLMDDDYFRRQGSDPAYQLWRSRARWLSKEVSEQQSAREQVTSSSLAFEDLLIDTLFDDAVIAGIGSQYRVIYESYSTDDPREDVNLLTKQAFGVSFDELDSLFADLNSSDSKVAREAVQTVNDHLGISEARFRGLIDSLGGIQSGLNPAETYRTLARVTLLAGVTKLEQENREGHDISGRLDQLSLTNAAFSRLWRFRDLVYAGKDLQDAELGEIYDILLQVRKTRELGDWLREEQNRKITLSPKHFKVPEALPLQFPPPEPIPLPAWRATRRDLRHWQDTLKARIEQTDTTVAALQQVVSATEEEQLPGLRDALITAIDTVEGDLASKAKQLMDRLLIDTQTDGCQLTTRISQAMETIQGFLWSLRTGQLQDTYSELMLTADHFDEEWKWIGSYATWRAAMFVHLYPENLLIPSLRRRQTPGFAQLIDRLHTTRLLTPSVACQVAQEYADYFEDVCTLAVKATCYGETRAHSDDQCRNHATSDSRNLFYMFSLGGKSGCVYWATFDSEAPSDTAQSFWDWVPGLGKYKVTRIVGSVPYVNLSRQRHIYLFLQVREGNEHKLVFTKFNLEEWEWDIEPEELELPASYTLYGIYCVRSSVYEEPPKLAFDGRFSSYNVSWDRAIYIRPLSEDGVEWEKKNSISNEESSESTGTYPGEEWSSYREKKLEDYDFLHAIVEFKKNNTHYRFICYQRDTPTGIGTSARLVYLSYQKEYLQQSGDQFLYFVGAVPISSTAWCVYYRDAEGRLYPFSTDQEFHHQDRIFDTAIDTINGPRSVIPHYGGRIAADSYSIILERGLLEPRSFITSYNVADKTNPLLGLSHPRPVNPICKPLEGTANTSSVPRSFRIYPVLSAAESRERLNLTEEMFASNFNEQSMFAYLEEACYFVPVQLGLQLQRHTYYPAALDWFRAVYDYSAPEGRERKVSYFLMLDQWKLWDLTRETDWLLDPLNPHEVAYTRQETYNRFTLLALVRCFLDYADAEFARDTAESVPRARTLYTTALELLDTEPLGISDSECSEMIGELAVEIGQYVAENGGGYWGTLPWGYGYGLPYDESAYSAKSAASRGADISVVTRILGRLLQTANVATLTLKVDAIRALLQEFVPTDAGESPESRIERIIAIAGKGLEQSPRSMSELITENREKIFSGSDMLVSVPAIHDTFMKARLSLSSTPAFKANAFPEPDSMVLTDPEAMATEFERPYTDESEFAWFESFSYQPRLSLGFCIPPNSVLNALRLRAELNLYKIRTCRNIAGMERQLDPYAAPTDTVSGLPQIGAGGQIVPPGTLRFEPTPYRYQVLIERAKQLAQMAAQTEAAMLAALEKRDAETYQLLKARQDVELTRQGVRLQDLRVREAEEGVTLSELQRDRAQILVETYQEWLDAELNQYEQKMIDAYERAARAKATVASLNAAMTSTGAFLQAKGVSDLFMAAIVAAQAIGKGVAKVLAIKAEEEAQVNAVLASHERRKDEWTLQKKVAEQDTRIGNQQIKLAKDHVRVVGQERKIAQKQADHAEEAADFLANKFTNVELYDWMSGVLEGVYSFFLQQATAIAKLAESQVAFERQEIPPAYIQANYWEAPAGMEIRTASNGQAPDRRGLTGSARLQQDIYQLDQYAFETDRRKLQLTKTISLANQASAEFQRFRETGVLAFATPVEMFDRDFPGHYLRLIKRVGTSVIALIPPVSGIHATLSATGLSKVVIGSGGLFQEIDVRRLPESVALSSPVNATGLFELTPETQQMLLPFEGMGVASDWELRLPKAANLFNFDTIADVLVTIEYTALEDFAYRQQVIRELDDSMSADRSFSFRQQLVDQWYELHNPDQTSTPMTVRFETGREDFPANLEDLRIQQIVLYFARKDGATFEVPVTSLEFAEQGSAGAVGGAASSQDGKISTRSGNAGSWIAILGKSPFGQWTLALPNSGEIRSRFQENEIEDILFVITYAGRTPPYPQ